ncbi:eCIS core domain-containing protein [Microseira wollei]|uniref:eCIS core domain-containing protein n=1 Tax=Microseira wollei NIES-4236 TaxID=2530354 RepID=A0AAV3X8A8_9CYAN|nr:DUF4157 domain-containing protein [Microseira wollei]GET37588.1 hypothetical protein MiSe_23420 [Microseira wollei NIES-4236]
MWLGVRAALMLPAHCCQGVPHTAAIRYSFTPNTGQRYFVRATTGEALTDELVGCSYINRLEKICFARDKIVHQRTHKSSSSPRQTQQKSSQFAPIPFAVQAQQETQRPPTQEEIEDKAFAQNKFEAFKLQLKEKSGNIAPVEQERLGVLQAKMNDYWVQRREKSSRFGFNLANIAIHSPDAPGNAAIQTKLDQKTDGEGEQQQSPQESRETASNEGMGLVQSAFQESNPQSHPVPPIQAKLTIGQPGDKYEQEADAVAAKVVEQINTPASAQSTQGQSVQRQEEEKEEEVQAKHEISALQRMEEPEERDIQAKLIQMRGEAIGGGEAATDLDTAINSARGSGQPLDASLQRSMGQAMGADFSGVRVHTDSQSDRLNQSIQAKAFTTGQDVFFRQGAYDPGSRGGQELIAHELTHVVQQSGGGVRAMTKGLTRDDGLEQAPKAENETTVNRDVTFVSPFASSHLRSANRQTAFLQAKLVTYKPKKDTNAYDEEEQEAALKAAQVDGLVEKAFDEFKNGDYTGASDAQIALYIKRKFEFDQGKGNMHPSTAAGYVIEGKANRGIQALGFITQGTDVMAGTRPDVVIPLLSNNQALVDITASNSIGHIFSKKGNWTGHKNIPYVAESVYPSINFTDVTATAALSQEQINTAIRLVEEQKIADELALKEWADQQQEKYYELQRDLRQKLHELCETAKSKSKQVLISGRKAEVWKEFGLNVNINLNAGQFKVEEISYEEQLKTNKNFTVQTHRKQERYAIINQLMGQLH